MTILRSATIAANIAFLLLVLFFAATGWLERQSPTIWLFLLLAIAPVLSLVLIVPRDALEMMTLEREARKSELRHRIDGDEAQIERADAPEADDHAPVRTG